MENYLVERETLGKFVDNLIAKKHQPIGDLDSLRRQSIKQLDDQIGKAVFGSLTKNQLDELNIMLDQGETDARAFQDFFKNAGVNLEQVITTVMQRFSQNFLGGENAQ